MTVECQVWSLDGDGDRDARFAALPRAGETINISLDGPSTGSFVVEKIVHLDLDVHGSERRPSIQLWVRNANRT